jgi:N-acetyl sugar amidotransferase
MNMPNLNDLKWCSNCLAMSTRPRLQFDEQGKCSACQWAEQKKEMDWSKRLNQLEALLDRYRRSDGRFDVVVPVSGGKDGSYVAYNLKHKFGMNPLCVTVTPPLALPVGEENLRNFVQSGFNHITVNVHVEVLRKLNRYGLIDKGSPYFGWLNAIRSVPMHIAVGFGVGLIFYGEDGEVEYGGSTETRENPILDVEYVKRVLLEDGHERILSGLDDVVSSDIELFKFPSDQDLKRSPIQQTTWSYFENWDPYRNYLLAKEYCGLRESNESSSGTFTNFSQTDQDLYALHTYLMYLKFGFGRANQDASIEIRRGAMDRDQALNLVRLFDGNFPEESLSIYLEYYQMTHEEFDKNLDKWANKNLFQKVDGRWQPLFTIR